MPLPDGGLSITSDVLGLALHLARGELRFYYPATGKKLLSYAEAEASRQAAKAARQAAEENAERLTARLRDLGIDPNSI